MQRMGDITFDMIGSQNKGAAKKIPYFYIKKTGVQILEIEKMIF